MAEPEKFHNDDDKMVYRFHKPDNADHYEAPADDAEDSKKSTGRTSSSKSTTTSKEK